ncbi:uncharacterized protein LOC127159719 isoform X2 [Labeo rohita]|nr:uncharacterized protein LOC127159719 isoform X2 [Labeo rohita]
MCCSVFNIMFCNCLFLGFAALICSLKARSKMNEGDIVKAQKYSRRACRTNTVAVIVTSAALTVFWSFILVESLMMVLSSIIHLGLPQQVPLTVLFPLLNCLLKGQIQNHQIMVEDTTLIHLEATIIEALQEPHTMEEDGEGEDKNTNDTVRCI